ncbi:hypothetical protein Tco_0011124 [Tanacetum coccineum]
MLNKDNYVPWSSLALCYVKSKPNGKLIYNSIMHGPYVKRMIPEPVKQMEVDDQAIQIILMGLPEDIYVVDSCETDLHEVDYTQLYDFWKYNQVEVNELRPERVSRAHDPLALMANSNNPYIYLIAQSGMNLGQDIQMQMVRGNGGNQYREYVGQNVRNHKGYNAVQTVRYQVVHNVVQNPSILIIGNKNGLIVIPKIANQNLNPNGNGLGHLGRNCTLRPRKRDAAFLQTQLLIAQKEEAGIQLQAKEFDFLAAAGDLEEIEEVNANYRSAEVHEYDNCFNNEIFSMFTQEEQYTELLDPIPEPHQVQQNDNNVVSTISNVEQSGGTLEQHPATAEETRALYDSLYNNLDTKFETVNSINHNLKETNAELTTELARYKNQEKYFEINQEKYDKLERFYQKSVYQEQCLTKKINALHLSSAKTITTLNEEIVNLNNQLSKEKSTVSSLQEEKKKLKSAFKIREDELLDKKIQLENKIKELDNMLVNTGQSIQTMHMLSPKSDSFYHTEQTGYQNPFYLKEAQQKQPSLYNGKVLLEKHDPPAVYDSEETLQLAPESRLKMKQLNKEIKPANYAKINHLSEVFVSQKANSREELYFSNTSKTVIVSKLISIPHEEFLDDTTPSVARKLLNELLKIVKDEIYPIVNQVDARVQNFEIQFLKEAAKFVSDIKSLANKAEIECLLRAIVSQDIMSIVQNPTVVETSDLQTELEHLKGKCKDTPCVSNTLDPLSQKLENENVELEFHALNYAKENAHLKTTYKNLFDSISLRAQLFDKVSEQKDITKGASVNTKFANQSTKRKPSLQSLNKETVFAIFSKTQIPPKVVETNDLSNPVTSNLVPTTTESKVVTNNNVIAPKMFRINSFKTSREDKFVPVIKVRESVRTNPITASQPHVNTKKHVNSDSNGLFSTGVDNTAKTRRPQPRHNIKNDRVPSASKSSCIKNKEVKVEEHHRNLLLSKNKKHMSSECNNVKLVIRNDKSEVICAMCKKCIITSNHGVCVLN